MKHHSLAERLEEFDSDHEPLKLTNEPTLRVLLADARTHAEDASRPARRTMRTRIIEIRDQGLRPFRIF